MKIIVVPSWEKKKKINNKKKKNTFEALEIRKKIEIGLTKSVLEYEEILWEVLVIWGFLQLLDNY